MSDARPLLILYGVPFSQPVRAVMWLLFMKRMAFELAMINPGSKGDNGSRNPAYLAKNPAGTIPAIEERDTATPMSCSPPRDGIVLRSRSLVTPLEKKRNWSVLGMNFIETLSQFHDRVPPRPFSELRPIVERNLGKPLEEVFSHVEPEALAAASLAQVHRATLREGGSEVPGAGAAASAGGVDSASGDGGGGRDARAPGSGRRELSLAPQSDG